MYQKLKNLDPLIHFILLVGIAVLSVILFNLNQKVQLLSQNKSTNTQTIKEIETKETVKEVDEVKIAKMISDAVATLSAAPKTVVTKTTTQTTGNRTSYIPMGSVATTTSTDWVDVADSDVYIDLKNDFGTAAYVTFETSLKVANGNGQAFVRLKDVTHGISVDGSELSSTDNANYIRVSSGKLNLWQGRNLYRVQIKSLNSFEVTQSNGKIKVVY
jgi:hypothetical protein